MRPSERPGSAAAGEGKHRKRASKRFHLRPYRTTMEFYASICCMVLTAVLACYGVKEAPTPLGAVVLLIAIAAGCAGAWLWDIACTEHKRFGGILLSALAILLLAILWFGQSPVLTQQPKALHGITRADVPSVTVGSSRSHV